MVISPLNVCFTLKLPDNRKRQTGSNNLGTHSKNSSADHYSINPRQPRRKGLRPLSRGWQPKRKRGEQ